MNKHAFYHHICFCEFCKATLAKQLVCSLLSLQKAETAAPFVEVAVAAKFAPNATEHCVLFEHCCQDEQACISSSQLFLQILQNNICKATNLQFLVIAEKNY